MEAGKSLCCWEYNLWKGEYCVERSALAGVARNTGSAASSPEGGEISAAGNRTRVNENVVLLRVLLGML